MIDVIVQNKGTAEAKIERLRIDVKGERQGEWSTTADGGGPLPTQIKGFDSVDLQVGSKNIAERSERDKKPPKFRAVVQVAGIGERSSKWKPYKLSLVQRYMRSARGTLD